jgi:hypothetical protein
MQVADENSINEAISESAATNETTNDALASNAATNSETKVASAKRESPKKCVVPFCHAVAVQGFSVFPKDPVRKKAWLEVFGLPHVKADARVCHSHFSESGFSVPKPTNLGKRRRLKFDAIPDLNLPGSKLPKLDHVLHLSSNVITDEIDISQAAPDPELNVPMEFTDHEHDYAGSSYMSVTLSQMDIVIIQQRIEIKKLRKDLQIANKKLKAYEADNLPQKKIKKIVHKALEHSVLSKGQINWHLSKKKRVRSNEWSNPDWAKVSILLGLSFIYFRFLTNPC